MKLLKLLIVALFCVMSYLSSGQVANKENYFRSPLSIPIISSGSFGEIRADHFHSGLDYKTQGTEGLPVFAVADGYVSRIKISPVGYGNALYITHPNGYVSVYAHLKEYNNTIDIFAKKEQYKAESFALDVMPDSSLLKVKKGDIIGFSGNSGRSFGAHLHFELREAVSENPVNPVLYGFKIKDNIPPVIKSIKIYPIGNNSRVNNYSEPLSLMVNGSGSKYFMDKTQNINVTGNIAFGIEAYDLADGVSNNKGVYSIEMLVDSVTCFLYVMDKMDFNENRSMNDLIDYKEFILNKKKIIQTKKAVNNNLPCYSIIKNNGILHFNDHKKHTITFVLKDEKQNFSKLSFLIENSDYPLIQDDKTKTVCENMIYCSIPKRIEKQDIILDFPVNAIFDSLCLFYTQEKKLSKSLSPVYVIQNNYTPVLNAYTISIKADSIKEKYWNKAVIVALNEKNESRSLGGQWVDGFVSAKSYEFGRFTVMIDSVPPVIKPVNIGEKKNMTEETTISFKITDNLSGIAKYRATINNKWVLMEYDEKKNLLKYNFDNNKTKSGNNLFELEVTDQKDNISNYKVVFIR